MERFDAEKARRVWNRVQGRTGQALPERSFGDLILIKTQTANLYQRLSRYYRGQTGTVLREFYQQEQEHIRILRGLYRRNDHKLPQQKKEPVEGLLQQCYRLKLQLLSGYEGYAGTQYSSVFQQFMIQEQAQCQFLLRLLEAQNRSPHRR